MRLLTRSSIYFIIASLFVFLVSGSIIYFLLQTQIYEEVDEILARQKMLVRMDLEEKDNFNLYSLPRDSSIKFSGPLNIYPDITSVYSDTMMLPLFDVNMEEDNKFDDYQDPEPYRLLKFSAKYGDEVRMITISQSLIETMDLIQGIIYSLMIVFVVMISVLFVVNYFSMKKLWLPFQKLLEQIRKFDFRSRRKFEAVKTDITEFQELNQELVKMTSKLTKDYFNLKEFSENASHEMQTPLAIIQTKLELLFQQKGQDEGRVKALNAAYQAVNRLSRLHHDLNLLIKIENQEYSRKDSLSLKELIEEQTENFSDIIEMKNLKFEADSAAGPVVQGSRYLLEIMFSNLFNNAIKHNVENGFIKAELGRDFIRISNSGLQPQASPELLFERFRKGNPAIGSTGLGLSIVKQICSIHGFEIQYTWQNGCHSFDINFNNRKSLNTN